jgi:hypothetical protein
MDGQWEYDSPPRRDRRPDDMFVEMGQSGEVQYKRQSLSRTPQGKCPSIAPLRATETKAHFSRSELSLL